MMKKDGGPAFPVSKDVVYPQLNGMSLRDWFAGQALVSVLACCETRDFDDVGAMSYAIADAMLAERDRTS